MNSSPQDNNEIFLSIVVSVCNEEKRIFSCLNETFSYY